MSKVTIETTITRQYLRNKTKDEIIERVMRLCDEVDALGAVNPSSDRVEAVTYEGQVYVPITKWAIDEVKREWLYRQERGGWLCLVGQEFHHIKSDSTRSWLLGYYFGGGKMWRRRDASHPLNEEDRIAKG